MVFNVFIVIVLLILAGTFAGLTLALFSLDISRLERKMRLGDKKAEKVYGIRKKGNLLLCTLLLGNVASYTIMAVFLGSITTGVIASTVATALIFVFGEIVPQAVFPRYALLIGSKLSWLIWICMVLFYPVAAPIAWILDKILGEELPALMSKVELKEMIKYHKDAGKEGIIDKDEERIAIGALSFSDIKVDTIMIPKDKVYFLGSGTTIDKHLLHQIKARGFSRIPVYNSGKDEVEGILYTKDLIGLRKHYFRKSVNDYVSREHLLSINEVTELDDLLNLFIRKNLQMAVVNNDAGKFRGIVTMEDVVEEILKTEIEEVKRKP